MMKVLLVDDHALFTSGLKSLLNAAGVTVAGTVHDGAAAVAAVRKLHPDVVLMDIRMPKCDGLTATRLIKAEFPEVKVVILTMTDEDQLLFEAIKNGASGFLLKNLEADEFLALLAAIARGEPVFSPGLAERLLTEFADEEKNAAAPADKEKMPKALTSRQKEVLTRVARGLTYKEAALELNISEATVKYHMNEILERLHLQNRSQAIAYAVQTDLSGLDESN